MKHNVNVMKNYKHILIKITKNVLFALKNQNLKMEHVNVNFYMILMI